MYFDLPSSDDLISLDPIHLSSKDSVDLFTRLSIFASGKTALCSADQAEFHPIGSILDYQDPVELFNSKFFNSYRKSWMSRDVSCHKQCTECTVAISRFISMPVIKILHLTPHLNGGLGRILYSQLETNLCSDSLVEHHICLYENVTIIPNFHPIFQHMFLPWPLMVFPLS